MDIKSITASALWPICAFLASCARFHPHAEPHWELLAGFRVARAEELIDASDPLVIQPAAYERKVLPRSRLFVDSRGVIYLKPADNAPRCLEGGTWKRSEWPTEADSEAIHPFPDDQLPKKKIAERLAQNLIAITNIESIINRVDSAPEWEQERFRDWTISGVAWSDLDTSRKREDIKQRFGRLSQKLTRQMRIVWTRSAATYLGLIQYAPNGRWDEDPLEQNAIISALMDSDRPPQLFYRNSISGVHVVLIHAFTNTLGYEKTIGVEHYKGRLFIASRSGVYVISANGSRSTSHPFPIEAAASTIGAPALCFRSGKLFVFGRSRVRTTDAELYRCSLESLCR